ncbi:MAG: lipopolysaccharide transport periplasmic protein LptA [Gammaproteobacteria bacterium]|nr:lipopolysaccharide transport periplasmic protein LptA [Gammaproteobacteria bacterium]
MPRNSPVLLLLLILAASPLEGFAGDQVVAAGADELLVTADGFEADIANGVSKFVGNARIQRGTLDIRADEIRLATSEGEVEAATLVGSPVRFSQAPTGKPPVAGEARRLEYDAANDVVTLTGKAWLTQGSDRFEGETIRYDLDTRTVLAQSNKETPERVRFILTPRKKAADKPQAASADKEQP